MNLGKLSLGNLRAAGPGECKPRTRRW